MSKNVIIIGGTSGIGLETAHYLRENNYNVLLGSRSNVEGGSYFAFQNVDVTNESSVEDFFLKNQFDTIDSLVYSAGITTAKKDIVNFNEKEYRKIHDVNLLGAILILKYSFPYLKKTTGRVVIVNSIAARTFSQFSGFEYTVTKAGLSGMVKQLAVEWANDGVLINSIFPSMVGTPMLYNNVSGSVLKNIEKNIPLGRIAKPNEISSLIEFLISDKNTYITGSGIDVNGGQYLSG